MTIQASAQEVFDACFYELDDDFEVNFASTGITIYWHTLRLDVQPKDFGKALKLIRDAKLLGARFE